MRLSPEACNTLPELALCATDIYDDKAAIIAEDGKVWTYPKCKQAIEQVARACIAAGIQAGDRVVLWLPNSPEWIIAALGLQMAGAILVPMNTRFKKREAAYILTRSGAKILITVNGFLGVDYLSMLGDDPLPSLEKKVVLPGEYGEFRNSNDALISWQFFLSMGDTVSEEERQRRYDALTGDSICDIMFTSGTTGAPKGVLSSHQQNIQTYAHYSRVMGLTADDRYLIVNPFFHAFGYKAGWLTALMCGATILPHAVFNAEEIFQRIVTEKVTGLPGPPTLYQSLMALPDFDHYNLSFLRLAITGGASVPVELIRRMKNELHIDIVLTAYGLTETCGVVSMCSPEDDAETIARTSGKAIPGTEIRIVDDELQELAIGQAGELQVRGYNIMQGYFADKEQTEKAFTADGWLHTGDDAIIDERGYLTITGRKKEMFIVGGFNCYPAEVENILLTHPGILQAAVIGVPDERMGEVAKAFIVPRPGCVVIEEEIIAWSRENISNYKVPRYIEVRHSLPTNPSGKVQKFVLLAEHNTLDQQNNQGLK